MPDSRSGDPGSKASKADSPGRSTRTTMQNVIIVAGTPGVGKTALSRTLARKTGSLYLNLGEFVKENKLFTRYDRQSQSYTINERRLQEALKQFFETHKNKAILIETHWLGRFMRRRPGMVALVVRLDPVVLAKRLKSRDWRKQKIWENVESELIDLSLYESVKFLGPGHVYQVDATRKKHRELVREAMHLLHSGSGWDGLTPNWLEKYDPVVLSRKIL